MLVLSRKQKQSVVFPNLGVSIEILRVNGNAVRVGIDAPKEINILRGELADNLALRDAVADQRKARHDLRNRLNSANLALHILKKQLEAGKTAEAEKSLCKALETFGEIDSQMSSESSMHDSEKKLPRALVVEDNDNERELLSGYLELCGYQVEAVDNGLSAMTYLAKHHVPDVVLLDMHMPGMDGPETVSAIRCDARYNGVKLFAVSGAQPDEIEIPMGEHGVDRWFAKPLKPAEFANELKSELNSCVVA